jgi:hypothetical protein
MHGVSAESDFEVRIARCRESSSKHANESVGGSAARLE